MKQANRTPRSSQNQAIWQEKMRQDGHGRREMNGFLRTLLVLVLVVVIAAVALAGYSSLYPVVVSVNTNVLNYQRSSGIDYQVMTRANDLTDQISLGMDRIYLAEFVDSVAATFSYDFTADRPAILTWSYRIQAVVQVRDAADPSQILLQKTAVILPDVTGESLDGVLHIREQVNLKLDEYQAVADAFAALQNLNAVYTLATDLVVRIETPLPVESLLVAESPSLVIPLSQSQFRIVREGLGAVSVPIVQPIRYQLVLQEIPFPIYPIAAGLCVLILIIFLVTTRTRRPRFYQRQLHRMLRLARRRLLMIADKAWEPEWCIAISDFRSMVRTARQLNHPIFCYIDRDPENTAAYFYVYYGENNYCFTWADQSAGTGFDMEPPTLAPAVPASARPAARPGAKTAKPEQAEPVAAQTAEPIPVLPETDEDEDIT